jgi:hypothetical protein
LTAYPSLAELVKPDALARVIKHLQTDGDHAHETILQLNALAHHIDISVESLTTPGLFLGQYNGGTVHGRDKQRSKLALLMREDRRHGVYNSKDRNKFLGFSSGHVWIHRTRTAHTPRGAGNGRGPVPPRPEKPHCLSGRSSEPIYSYHSAPGHRLESGANMEIRSRLPTPALLLHPGLRQNDADLRGDIALAHRRRHFLLCLQVMPSTMSRVTRPAWPGRPALSAPVKALPQPMATFLWFQAANSGSIARQQQKNLL